MKYGRRESGYNYHPQKKKEAVWKETSVQEFVGLTDKQVEDIDKRIEKELEDGKQKDVNSSR